MAGSLREALSQWAAVVLEAEYPWWSRYVAGLFLFAVVLHRVYSP